MPNIITHYLFASAVNHRIQNETVKACIQAYPHEFIIGSNGPDYLFFYQFFKAEGQRVRDYGSLLHGAHINDFYRIALRAIEQQENEELKKAMTSYVAGHLCHWALDSRSHPYIFYRTGNCQGISASMHHRFESMLDAIMLKKMMHTDVRRFNYDELALPGKLSSAAVHAVYGPVIQEVFHETVTLKTIDTALKDWHRLNQLLHDPYEVKINLIRAYEHRVKQPWLYSGNVVPVKIDPKYDILNEDHQHWCYPSDENRQSNESFTEIFQRAVSLGEKCIHLMNDPEALMEVLQDETYDMGVKPGCEMRFFDLIYDEADFIK